MCPVCGSESFTYISRWIPTPETERPLRPSSAQADVYKELLTDTPSRGRRLLRGGLLGLTALGVAGWAWRSSRANGKPASKNEP